MRRTASEKMEIIRLIEETDLPIRATLRQLGVPRSTFYGWYQRYVDEGFDGLHDKKPVRRPRWNAIPEKIQKQVLDLALERTDLSPRELAFRYTDEKYGSGRRLFRMVPIHHHFEQLGWPESKVVVRFWIMGILCAMVAFSALKIR